MLEILKWMYVFVDKINISLIAAHWHLNNRNEDECENDLKVESADRINSKTNKGKENELVKGEEHL